MAMLPDGDPLQQDVDAIARIAAVPTILRVVAETTGLRFAAVARVTKDRWVCCAVHDGLAFGLVPGGTLDVTTTLCAQVRDTLETVVIDHASQDPAFCGHITPKMYGFESYISVPIFLSDGAYFGTICGLDPLPAQLNQPKILSQLSLFAELISLSLEAEQRDEATRSAKRRLESFVMGAPAAIAVFRGPDLVYELANARYQQALGNRPIIGLPARQALPELEHSGVWTLLERVYATGEPHAEAGYRSETSRLAGADVGQLYFDWVAQPTHDASGRVDGVLVYTVDVTEQVHARHALERKNLELDNFAYVTSHDLKGPLRGIGNLAQWLEDDLGDKLTGESRGHLELLRRRVTHMNGLIDGILKFARVDDAHKLVTDVDVGELLVEVVEMLAPSPTAKIVIGPGMPILRTSRTALQQVFLNLLSNALKHAQRPDVTITVSASDASGRWVFAVSDDGPGIPAQHRERVWKLFQSLTSGVEDGNTGIGLAIVKKLVEARHGKVWIESDAGAGATFYFSWPAQPSLH